MIWLFFRGRYPGGRLKRGESITLSLGNYDVLYRWGPSHWWGCDDAGFIADNIFAVFDGISITPEGYGIGGLHAAELAKRADELVSLIKTFGFREGVRRWEEVVGERYTTAVIASPTEVAWVGDSVALVDGEIVTHYKEGPLTEWFGHGFHFKPVKEELCIATDGVFNSQDDLLKICRV
jgi:hypothetical protein